MKLWRWAVVAAALLALPLAGAGLEELFKADAELWNLDAAGIAKKISPTFKPVAAGSDQLRHYGEGLTFADAPVPEALITLEDGKLSFIEIYLYNKGDSKEPLNQRDYNARVKGVLNQFAEAYPGVEPLHLVRSLGRSSVICNIYSAPGADAALRYNTDAERNGCIALMFAPPGKMPRTLDFTVKKVSSEELLKRVTRTDSGDVVILVPMVDQGDKGFCLPASVSRVLRYYGSLIDQNTVATMVASDGEKGTNLVEAMKALRKGSGKIGASTRELLDGESLTSKKGCAKLVKEYNKQAAKLSRGRDQQIAKIELKGDKVPKLDPECFKAARQSDKAVKKFADTIAKNIDRGQLICWNVLMFKAGAEGALAAGVPTGHTRIICGYNAQTNEVLFTDSWGAGFELGRMPMADAWAFTLSLFTIEPR